MPKNETKKRLLIRKWRSLQSVALDLEEAHNEVLADKDAEIDRLKDELDETKETVKELEDEADSRGADLESAITDIKYWFLDAMVHGKLVKTPREMLRRVEEVLG